VEGGISAVFKDIKIFFSELFKGLKKKRIAKFTPIIAVACLLAILIPTLIAIWQVYFKEAEKLTPSDGISVVLYDGEGDVLSKGSASESNLSVSPLVDLFYNLYLSKSPVESSPELPYESPNYKVEITYGETEIKFSCYFTEKLETSYILDTGNNLYTVDDAYYRRFLDMEYSDAAYSSATPPTLTTKDGETVLPCSVNWKYKKLDGSHNQSDNFVISAKGRTYSASGSIGLTFSRIPDTCLVIVTDKSENEIYRGDLSGLSSITAKAGDNLIFLVEAEWKDGSEADSFGSIRYDFELQCKNLSSFSISKSEVRPGGYFIISAFDIEEGSYPSYSPDLSDENSASIFNYAEDANTLPYLSYVDALAFMEKFEPSFFKDGTALRAIVPIPYNTPAGEFTFTLSSGIATSTHTVKITNAPSAAVIPITNNGVSVSSAISEQAIDEVVELAKSLSSMGRDALLARGEFLSPLSHNYTREYSYGDSFTLEDEPLESLTALGNAYLSASSEGRKVCAANIGVVLKVGHAAHLGNFVVLDHGGGLLTWYCNLSDFDVREGDAVAKGETIGKSGECLLLDGNGVLILCSIKGTLVDPSLILGKEILYTTS
jgi:hypothetical protein